MIVNRFKYKPQRVSVGGSGGGGKGAGGGGGTAREDKDTLTSRAYARVIDALGEGPIDGFADPVHPLQCIFLDGTPIENQDGRIGTDGVTVYGGYNFHAASGNFTQADVNKGFSGDHIQAYTAIQSVQGPHDITLTKAMLLSGSGTLWGVGGSLNYENFQYYLMKGTQGQGYLPGFSAEENTTAVGVQVKQLLPYTHSFTDPTIDAIRIDIRFPRLQKQDTTSGDVHGTSVRLQIQIDANGGGFQTVIDDTVTGKASAPYIRTYRIDLASYAAPWTVRVKRIKQDSTSEALQDDTYVDSFTEVTYGKLRHPNTALVGIHIDAESFQQIPVRSYRIHGLQVKIPMNYDPIARTYATSGPGTTMGVWDGTFKTAWTNNPAWCWYDMATNARYGLGHLLVAANIDKFALYTIARYCDQLVPNGAGGTEPRMTCNLYLQKAEDAIKVLNDMASIFRGMLSYINGAISPVQDAPTDTSAYRMFSPANVVGGKFQYVGVALRARHNAAMVSWNDLTDNGNQKFEYVEDSDAVAIAGGVNQLSVAGFGCTSRAQARRLGLWSIYAEKILTDTVTFSTGLEGYFVKPGQIIQIQDPFRAGQVLSGRLQSATTTVLTLDRSVTLLAGKTYTVGVYQPSTGLLITATVSNSSGATTSLTVPALAEAPDAGSIFQLAANDLTPELFRVLGIVAKDDNVCEITALQYNESLYGFVDFDHPLDVPETSTLPTAGVCLPPGAITVEELLTIDTVHGTTRALELSWVASPDVFIQKYRLSYRYNSSNWITRPDVYSPQARIDRVDPGTYELSLIAINRVGIRSRPPVTYTYVVGDVNNAGTPSVTGLELYGAGHGLAFNQRDAHFVWRINAPIWFTDGSGGGGNQNPHFQAYDVQIWNGIDIVWHEAHIQSPEYIFTETKNREAVRIKYGAGTLPLHTFRIEVRILDTFNNLSAPSRLTVTNPIPGVPTSPSIMGTLNGVSIQWVNAHDSDLDGVNVYKSEFPNDSSPAFIGKAAKGHTSFAHDGVNPAGDTSNRYYWIASVDTFGSISQLIFVGGLVPGYAVAPVNITPAGGYVSGATTITLDCPTTHTDIYWTVGLGGRSGWALYDPAHKPTVSSSVSFYAYAVLHTARTVHSVIRSVDFTNGGGARAANPTFTPDGGSYGTPSGTQVVFIATTTTGSNIRLRYTVDGTTPSSTNGTLISGTSGNTVPLPSGTTILKAIAYSLTGTPLDSQVTTATYIISESGGSGQVAEPTFSPVAGQYIGSTVSVAITSTTSGAEISYTTDGELPSPTVGTVVANGSTVSVPIGATLRAMAFKSPLINSATNVGTYTAAPMVATPTYDNPAGAYSTYPKTITVATGTSGCHIKCTRDGSIPTAGDTIVGTETLISASSGTISVTAGQTLKAIAYRSNYNDSVIASGLYSLLTTVATPTFNPIAGAYPLSDYPKSVIVATATSGASLSYTTDGSTPSQTHGTIISSNATTISVPVGTTVKAIGFKAGLSDSAVATGAFTMATRAATPTFTPAAGAYPSTDYPKTITIATATSGCQMRYTKDGSTPTETHGTLISASSGTASVTSGQTLKAIAYRSGFSDSLIASGAYSTSSNKVANPSVTPPGGVFTQGTNVSVYISTATPGAVMRWFYGVSPPDPTETSGTLINSTSGTISVHISGVQYLKVIAYKSGMSDSDIVENEFDSNL